MKKDKEKTNIPPNPQKQSTFKPKQKAKSLNSFGR